MIQSFFREFGTVVVFFDNFPGLPLHRRYQWRLRWCFESGWVCQISWCFFGGFLVRCFFPSKKHKMLMMINETSTSYDQNASYSLNFPNTSRIKQNTPFINSLSNNQIFLGCRRFPSACRLPISWRRRWRWQTHQLSGNLDGRTNPPCWLPDKRGVFFWQWLKVAKRNDRYYTLCIYILYSIFSYIWLYKKYFECHAEFIIFEA